jgi:alpha-1,2-glucosyltransferase
MLYIWPYILFFSWPVILPSLLRSLHRHVKSAARITQLRSMLPRAGLAVCTTVVMLAVVRLNTIVHPFTLADNRHYVFYVFRILCRHPLIKYAVTPIYFLCAWLVLRAFGPSAPQSRPAEAPPAKISLKGRHSKAAETKATRQEAGYPNKQGVRVSFVLIWLASTSLSLITAPLVEPRYFIIPWVMWRLHIHPPSSWSEPAANNKPPTSKAKNGGHESLPRSSTYLEVLPTAAELIWYVLINAATGYLFLYRGFEWPQEPGEVQRFMW